MVPPALSRLALVAALIGGGAHAASAQTAPSFEIKFKPPPMRQDTLPSAPLPDIGAVTKVPLPQAVVDQLDEAARRAIAGDPSLRGLSTTRRPAPDGVQWALTVDRRNRADFAALIDGYAENLRRCFYSLDEDAFTPHLAVMLGGADTVEPLKGKVAGGVMLANWKKDRCATRGTNAWPEHLLRLRGVTAWMLTELRDRAVIWSDQVAFDVAEALGPLFFDEGCGRLGDCEPGGLWMTEKAALLRRAMDAVATHLITTDELAAIASPTYRTFWDWTLALVARKPGALRSFATTVAAACVDPDGLGTELRLQTCIDQGKVRMVPLRIGTAELVAAGGAR